MFERHYRFDEIVKAQGLFSFRKRQNTNNNKKYKDAQI
jgi:hypothetical protein